MIDDTTPRGRGVARAVAVVGARGGCGASALAAALARKCLEDVERVVLVDADLYGSGIELALGLEEAPGLRWDDLANSSGSLDPGQLVAALPRWEGVPVLGPRAAFDLRPKADPALSLNSPGTRAAFAALRSGQDLLVIDLPRQALRTSPAILADAIVVLTGQDIRSVGGTARLVSWARSRELAVHGVVLTSGSRSVSCADLGKLIGSPVLRMRPERDLRLWLEKGFGPPPGSRRRLNRTAAALSQRFL